MATSSSRKRRNWIIFRISDAIVVSASVRNQLPKLTTSVQFCFYEKMRASSVRLKTQRAGMPRGRVTAAPIDSSSKNLSATYRVRRRATLAKNAARESPRYVQVHTSGRRGPLVPKYGASIAMTPEARQVRAGLTTSPWLFLIPCPSRSRVMPDVAQRHDIATARLFGFGDHACSRPA
jgi:hypothetical protein